jgi:hypothetical protein
MSIFSLAKAGRVGCFPVPGTSMCRHHRSPRHSQGGAKPWRCPPRLSAGFASSALCLAASPSGRLPPGAGDAASAAGKQRSPAEAGGGGKRGEKRLCTSYTRLTLGRMGFTPTGRYTTFPGGIASSNFLRSTGPGRNFFSYTRGDYDPCLHSQGAGHHGGGMRLLCQLSRDRAQRYRSWEEVRRCVKGGV